MTKPTTWPVCPAKTQISLATWSESWLCAQWVAKDSVLLHANSEDWSDWVDVQADPNLRWAHMLFLAHLSRRLIWWAYRIGRPLSSVVVVVHFSSETTESIKVKFHMALLWDGWTKICPNVPGHMTTMAAMPMYGKNLKKSSSLEPKGHWPWNYVCKTGCSSTTKFAQMMDLSWPWPILRQGQIWFLMLLYRKKVKQWIFHNLL